MLTVSNISASYGRIQILNDINFDVKDNEVIGILGQNGMGKTTLMKTLMGIIPAKSGQVIYHDLNITRDPPHVRAKKGIGYVPQGRGIFPQLTVMDNLKFAAGKKNSEKIEQILTELTMLKPLLNRSGGALSGGEQQILAVARCLCTNPQLILLDEPTEGVQPSIIDDLEVILKTLRGRLGFAIIIVEQKLDFVAKIADRVLIIQKGTITNQMSPNSLSDPDVLNEFIGLSE